MSACNEVCQVRRGPGAHLGQGEAGEEIYRREVLDDLSRSQEDGQGVYLGQIARPFYFVPLGFPTGVRA